jgi:hypothetical protein
MSDASAPLSELRLGHALRRYERLKLALLIIVLVLNLAMGTYLIAIARNNRATLQTAEQSLVILRCTTDRDALIAANGKPRTQAAAQAQLTKCIANGGPPGTRVPGALVQTVRGATGRRGPAGPRGAAGPRGTAGLAGAPGPRGFAGPQGGQGAKGSTGEQGMQGPQGPQGMPGTQGGGR